MSETAPAPSNTMDPNGFLAALSDLIKAETAKDRGVATVRNVRKRFENMGCDMPALALFLTLRKLDSGEAQTRLQNALRYARWADLKIGDQADLLKGLDDDRPSEKSASEWNLAEAYQEGVAAGKAGRDINQSRYTLGTPASASFADGWGEGQTILGMQLFGRPPEKDDGILKPAKRGAPKKAAGAAVSGAPRGRGGRRRAA